MILLYILVGFAMIFSLFVLLALVANLMKTTVEDVMIALFIIAFYGIVFGGTGYIVLTVFHKLFA